MGTENNEECDLSEVILTESTDNNAQAISHKRLKRVLHFSDGDLEEYSEDEIDAQDTNKVVSRIDPKALNWIPWTWYQTTWFGNKVLDGCDFVGEWLANFFGITGPKYQFEIDEFYRLQALENEQQHKQDLEMGGWNKHNANNLITDTAIQ